MTNDNLPKWIDGCKAWIRKFVEESGGKAIVLGISGGKDSTICAKLCADAVGAENVYGVSMPAAVDDVEDCDVSRVFEETGIKRLTVSLCKSYCSIAANVVAALLPDFGITCDSRINLLPRLRMATLYAVAQSVGGRVVCTDNKSEWLTGYFTLWGDGVGDFAPLRDLYVSDVLKVGEALGLPHDLVHKTPDDGLSGKSDEDKLGFTYAQLEEYVSCNDIPLDVEEKIRKKIEATEFKRKLVSVPCYMGD